MMPRVTLQRLTLLLILVAEAVQTQVCSTWHRDHTRRPADHSPALRRDPSVALQVAQHSSSNNVYLRRRDEMISA